MSIQIEIARLLAAKQNLSDWLVEHDVRVSNNAKLNELVNLLDTVSTGGSSSTPLVPVDVLYTVTSSVVKTVLPKGSQAGDTLTLMGNSYLCPANSLLVVYGTCNGGTTSTQAYPTITVTGDLDFEPVYYTASNAALNKPIGIFAIHIGEVGGTVTLTRKTSSGAIM